MFKLCVNLLFLIGFLLFDKVMLFIFLDKFKLVSLDILFLVLFFWILFSLLYFEDIWFFLDNRWFLVEDVFICWKLFVNFLNLCLELLLIIVMFFVIFFMLGVVDIGWEEFGCFVDLDVDWDLNIFFVLLF